jgi:hypothetical protein
MPERNRPIQPLISQMLKEKLQINNVHHMAKQKDGVFSFAKKV